jgi:hypothetical protein
MNIYVVLLLIRTKGGEYELDLYISRKHDELLASTLEAGSYKKTTSLAIVDGFIVDINEEQVMFSFSYDVSLYDICTYLWSIIFL